MQIHFEEIYNMCVLCCYRSVAGSQIQVPQSLSNQEQDKSQYTGYEDKKGTAKVQLIQVYEPQGITYVLKIIPPTSEVISYKGYLESPVNFSAFE